MSHADMRAVGIDPTVREGEAPIPASENLKK